MFGYWDRVPKSSRFTRRSQVFANVDDPLGVQIPLGYYYCLALLAIEFSFQNIF